MSPTSPPSVVTRAWPGGRGDAVCEIGGADVRVCVLVGGRDGVGIDVGVGVKDVVVVVDAVEAGVTAVTQKAT